MSHEDLKPGLVEAVDAMFALTEAIEKNGLTIGDLEDISRLSVEEGQERMAICLSMASIAVERSKGDA